MNVRNGSPSWDWTAVLSGVVPPLISPLEPSGDADREGMARLVEHLLEAGCSGLFVTGGCGEGPWLTSAQRAGVIRAAVDAAGRRAPVLAGVTLPSTGPACESARQLADEGAAALVVTSPYYFAADADAQRRHVEAVLDATPLPVLLYNIPQCTHQPFAPETVGALARHDRVIGIKDSAGDAATYRRFVAVKRDRPAFRVLQGAETQAAGSLADGGDGLVPGLANVAPAHFVGIRRAAAAGDAAEADRLQEEVGALGAIYGHGAWISALKAACALLGIGLGIPARPNEPVDDAQRAAIGAVMERVGVRVREPAQG
ncbi:MAG TPA: dihydrodipicolinate synthase family protein [Chloroflexota bacterium]|jgi:4-hydroxy-tetrahydrodipicolinate synthase